jgi:DNA-binding response OmpR family regulator
MGQAAKILLIDDSQDVGYLVEVTLRPHILHHAFSLSEARRMMQNESYDLILIDVMLPDGDGFKFCSEISGLGKWQHVPKILLTAKQAVEDKVFGLACGADDYVTKPFSTPELKARVDVRLAKALQGAKSSLFQFSEFEFDCDFHRCFVVNGTGKLDLELTPTEFQLFLVLVRNAGAPLTRQELISAVWSHQGIHVEPRNIDTHIAHLRRKLGSHRDVVEAVYGKGYAVRP